MFDTLRRFFSEPETDEGVPEAEVAVAALLVHLAAVDGVVTDEERETVSDVLEGHFDLDPGAVDDLIAEATRRDADAVDLYQFTSQLSRLEESERVAIIKLMWEVVYADKTNHELEDNMVWRVAELIGVSARQRTVLRNQVRRGKQS